MTIESEMRQVLLNMRMLQFGSTQQFNASGGRSDNPDPRPSGEAWTLADHWAAEWDREPSHRTLEAARAELESWKKRTAPAVTVDLDERVLIIEDGEGFSAVDVARRFRTTPSRVRSLRAKADREIEFGLPTEFAQHRETSSEKDARIRNLADQGCTERQIAFQVGVGKSTVRRALGRAA